MLHVYVCGEEHGGLNVALLQSALANALLQACPLFQSCGPARWKGRGMRRKPDFRPGEFLKVAPKLIIWHETH